jgi:MraZ protein
MLTGTFRRTVDEKHRIAVPKKLRTALHGDENGENAKPLFVTPGTDGSLAIYSEVEFGKLAAKLSERSPTGKDVRAFSRLFYSRAQRVEMDSQGRIRLEPELVQLAKLEKDVVMVGVGNRIELWAEESWQAYEAKMQAQFDRLAEDAFGG